MFEKEYSQYWKTVVETMLDGLMVVDPGGILSVNKAFEILLGYSGSSSSRRRFLLI